MWTEESRRSIILWEETRQRNVADIENIFLFLLSFGIPAAKFAALNHRIAWETRQTMVPQQSLDNSTGPTQHTDIKEKSELMAIDEQVEHSTVFGSQQVKETSNTPYTDATQVSHLNHLYPKKNSTCILFWKFTVLLLSCVFIRCIEFWHSYCFFKFHIKSVQGSRKIIARVIMHTIELY